MLRKKLLTLACVLAILAFGGCIFIPSGPPKAPRIEFNGIRTIQVDVANNSESHHIDPAQLARAVVKSINSDASATGIKGQLPQAQQAQPQAATPDAVLKITVLSESATLAPVTKLEKNPYWTFQFRISTTLTKSDGEVVWSRTNADFPNVRTYARKDPPEGWQNPALLRDITSRLGTDLLVRMYYAK
jgi:hypothetical protein